MEQSEKEQISASLKKLRAPFEENQISKLPKGTKKQNECAYNEKKSCKICGGFHHPKIIHLDYVGHAALTDRMLDVDPFWNWEPVNTDDKGLPTLDSDGGMWIRLTICGITRLGYGDAQGKHGPNATKERIGDALRNAAMRFGAALDLWHKGDLHGDPDKEPPPKVDESKPLKEQIYEDVINQSPDIKYQEEIDTMKSSKDMTEWWNTQSQRLKKESQETQKKVGSYWAQIMQIFKDKDSSNE